MKLEIIKDSIEDSGKISYAIRKKFLGIIPIYKTFFPFSVYPTFNRFFSLFGCAICFIGTLISSIIGLIESAYLLPLCFGIGDILFIYYYNYSFRVLGTISEAENVIKDYLKKKNFRKEVVQIYDIKKNEITVEKREELK